MPCEKYRVELSTEEIALLREITHNGRNHSAKTIMHANVLLNTNDASPTKKTAREISEIFGISKTTVMAIRTAYSERGIEPALNRKTRLDAPILSKITGGFLMPYIRSVRLEWLLVLIASALQKPESGHPRNC